MNLSGKLTYTWLEYPNVFNRKYIFTPGPFSSQRPVPERKEVINPTNFHPDLPTVDGSEIRQTHQLRETVVEIPFFKRFYTFEVVFWLDSLTINSYTPVN